MRIALSLASTTLFICLACGGGGGGSSSSSSTPAGPPANTIFVGGSSYYGSDMIYNPTTLTVTAGTTVTWQWKGGSHTLTSYAKSGSPTFPGVPMPGQNSGSYSYDFTTAGTYYFYCEYHGNLASGGAAEATGMAGKVVVN